VQATVLAVATPRHRVFTARR